jgi:hypothetical protein
VKGHAKFRQWARNRANASGNPFQGAKDLASILRALRVLHGHKPSLLQSEAEACQSAGVAMLEAQRR